MVSFQGGSALHVRARMLFAWLSLLGSFSDLQSNGLQLFHTSLHIYVLMLSFSFASFQDQSLRLFFDDYRGPNLPASSSQGFMQPQLSPSSPSQWQLATSALSRQGSGRLPHSSFSRDAATVHSPKMNGVQRQGSDSLNTNMLQRQPSNAHNVANSASHVADNSTGEGSETAHSMSYQVSAA